MHNSEPKVIKLKIHKRAERAFLRWCSNGDAHYQQVIGYALETLLPPFDEAGFLWVERDLEGFKTPSFMIDMERRNNIYAERVTFNFDKYRRYKFNIIVRVKEFNYPQNWLYSGDLVGVKGKSYRQKWWGASWLSLNKRRTFIKEVDKVSVLLPQILDFISTGKDGPNIWKF